MYDLVDLFRPKLPTTFGSASWATKADLRRAKMLEPGEGKNRGPIIGCLTPAEIGGSEVVDIYMPGEGHLFTAAPTRAGKGLGQIITNLLTWPGSVVVLDIKGENWERTAGWRQAEGHRVIRFAPFESGGSKWNPLEEIDLRAGNLPNDPVRQENVRYLVNLMVTPNPQAREPYWDNAAKSLLQGIMLYVATAPLAAATGDKSIASVRERTMREVRRLIMLDPAGFTEVLTAMSLSKEDWVRETAGAVLQMAPAREQSASVKTILMEHTNVWAYSRVQEATSKSEFSFAELRTPPKKGKGTTIYLIIPPEELAEYRAVLRVLIGSCMRELRRGWSNVDHGGDPPVLMLLDEFPQLGYMQPIEQALLYLASYGVKFWFFVQDLSGMREHYEKTWSQFIANCSARCFFGVSDIDTAKMVSEMSGFATVRNRSYQAGDQEGETTSTADTSGSSSGPGFFNMNTFRNRTFSTAQTRGSNFGTTMGFVGRPLFMPDEVLRMPFGSMIGLIKGMPAVKGQLVIWNERWPERGRVAPPT